ncbi:hypothetical protein BU17DRAFT_66163 [Hysterangium stoloniferum]|nr:hypothetical protein BU17DRAFT_66163 [Hysterangium stoloniferum]
MSSVYCSATKTCRPEAKQPRSFVLQFSENATAVGLKLNTFHGLYKLPDSMSEVPAPENSIPQDYRETFQGRQSVTKWADPCDHASKASLECLNRNDYDRDKCTEFFRAYRECKIAWLNQRREDRRAGRPTN